MLLQDVERRFAVAAQEQLAELVEQTCRRDGGQYGSGWRNGAFGRGVKLKIELGGESCRSEDAYGVFAKSLLGIADQTQCAPLYVGEAVAVIEQHMVNGVVVQRVDREVASEGVLVDCPVRVVAQDDSLARQDGPQCLVSVFSRPPERRNLDDFPLHAHVGDAESASHQAHAREYLANLFWRCAAGHVEVLGRSAEQ